MIRFPKTCLVTLLVLLQMMAPLVHAHSGIDGSPAGLHIPGLEFFGKGAERQVQSITRHELSNGHTGIIVGIGTGLNHRSTVRQFDSDAAAPVGRLAELPPPNRYSTYDTLFSPSFYFPAFYPSSAPRAPPQHALT